MSRLVAIACVLVARVAAAQPSDAGVDAPPADAAPVEQAPPVEPTPPSEPEVPAAVEDKQPLPEAPPDLSDQVISAEVGLASGGRVTPGGLRIGGHYLYQLAARDWFDGSATFTYGGGDAACFRDRMNAFICDHGLADGSGVEITATVRRFLGGQRDQFWPFVRAGIGLSIVRFSDDSVTGFAVPLHAGAGVRVSLTPSIAVVGLAELLLGFGAYNHELGVEPLWSLAVSGGAEFKL